MPETPVSSEQKAASQPVRKSYAEVLKSGSAKPEVSHVEKVAAERAAPAEASHAATVTAERENAAGWGCVIS